jgi:hypothetical protein
MAPSRRAISIVRNGSMDYRNHRGRGPSQMSVFLFTTLLTFVLLFLMEIVEPTRATFSEREGTPNPAGRRVWAILVSYLLVLAFSWGLIIATFKQFHPEVGLVVTWIDAFTGRNAASLLFGIITGVLLYRFLTRIFFHRPGTALEVRDQVELVLLIVFFALGIGGEEAIRGWTQRVSKVSAFGTEVSFFDTASRNARTRFDGSPITAAGTAGGNKSPSSFGSSDSSIGLRLVLSSFSHLISRDRDYIELIASLNKSEKEKLDKEKLDKKNIEGLRATEELALLTIDTFAGCLQEVYSQTGDTSFVNARLLGLTPALRLLIVPNQHDDEVAKRAADLLFKEADELADFVFFAELATNAEKSRRNSRSRKIEEACNSLFFMLAAEESWQAKKEKIANVNDPIEADWTWKHKDDIRRAYADNKLNRKQREEAPNQRKEALSEIEKSVSILLAHDTYQRFPYISIVYASVMAQLGRHESALFELDQWIQKAKAENRRGWYLARALNIMTNLTEEWLRRPSTDVDSVTRQWHIGNLQDQSRLLEELFDLPSFKAKYAALSSSLEQSAFQDRPRDHRACTIKDDDKSKRTAKDDGKSKQFERLQRAFTAAVASDQLIPHHAFLHPEYPTRYSHDVARIVNDFNKMDFYCLVPAEGAAGIDQARAETLRLYAEMKLRDAPITASIKGNESADVELKSGLDATELALEIIRPLAQGDRNARDPSQVTSDDPGNDPATLFKRMQSTLNIETYETLLSVKAELSKARKELN